jgi:hypothetical protein
VNHGKVLVVDDDEVQGQRITEHLWRHGVPVVFVQYDPKMIDEGRIPGNHIGVRTIVMDIDLLGGGQGDSSAWGIVQAEIERLLHDNNGPWKLITWTSHEYQSEGLYDHLTKRMNPGIRPVALESLDKEAYVAADSIGQEPDLAEAVLAGINVTGPLACLGEWEANTRQAASRIIHTLTETANVTDGDDCCNLQHVLYELAVAEAGKGNIHSQADVSAPVSRILTALLADEMEQNQLSLNGCACPEDIDCGTQPNLPINWLARVNTMVNFDISQKERVMPGGVYRNIEATCAPYLDVDLTNSDKCGAFIRNHFLQLPNKGSKRLNKTERKKISAACGLVLVDITAACDHAQGKGLLRRCVVGCYVPIEHEEHMWRFKDISIQEERDVGNLQSQNLLVTPVLSASNKEGKVFRLLLDANLPISVPNASMDKLKGGLIGRIRETMLRDLSQRIAFHSARPGHIALSPER